MGDKTGIQWTDATWNPTTGCDRVSPGCDNCYAMTQAKRLKAMGQAKYQRDGDPRTSGPGFGLSVHPGALNIPLSWTRPRRVFVNSMSDLFHDQVPEGFVGSVWDTMARTPRHTYQILTKRHARMRAMLKRWEACGPRGWQWRRDDGLWCGPLDGPLPNVHLGVSVEDQRWADIRIPALMETPAAIRFLSMEPLLGPVTLSRLHAHCPAHDFAGGFCSSPCPDLRVPDWVIVGGESGPNARPMQAEWVRSIIRQCQDTGIPVFVKQLGTVWAREHGADSHGGDWGFWPEDLRVREFPQTAGARVA